MITEEQYLESKKIVERCDNQLDILGASCSYYFLYEL